jgi:hypothetical protein
MSGYASQAVPTSTRHGSRFDAVVTVPDRGFGAAAARSCGYVLRMLDPDGLAEVSDTA